MYRISIKQGMTQPDLAKVLEWTNTRGAEFLHQYAGVLWKFPLTDKQVLDEIDGTYSIFESGGFTGMIQVMWRKDSNAHLGRFLIDPDRTGRGIGTEALKTFCRMLFEEEKTLQSISLSVYEFNTRARNCYVDCGFAETEKIYETPELVVLRMKLYRSPRQD